MEQRPLGPLMVKLRAMQAVPRLLADDLETMAFDPRHAATMRKARTEIDRHLATMGTRASTGKGKSHVFASAKSGRRRLRKEMEESGRAVLSHWRDLGAHANITKATWGPSLTKRMQSAARMAGPIRALPAEHEAKARLIKLKMLPAALYGVETSFVADTGLRGLRGAVFSILKPRCDLGGNAAHLFAEAASRGHELDPELLIAYRRLIALDRA